MISLPSISVVPRPLRKGLAAAVAFSFVVSAAGLAPGLIPGLVAEAAAQEVPSGQTLPQPDPNKDTGTDPAKTAGTPAPEISIPEIKIRAWNHDSFGRIVFEWTSKVVFAAKVEGEKLFVRFSKPLHSDLTPVLKQLSQYVTAAELDDDGKTAVFTLSKPFSYRAFLHDYAVVVDLSDVVGDVAPAVAAAKPAPPAPAAEPPAPAQKVETQAAETPSQAEKSPVETKPAKKVKIPAKPSKKPKQKALAAAKKLNVRIGSHPGFTRFVFDWTSAVEFKVRRRGVKATVSFDKPARINVGKVRKALPPAVPEFNAATSATGLSVDMTLTEGSRLRHFRTGAKVVVDVLKPTAETAKAAKKSVKQAVSPPPKPAPVLAKSKKGAKSARPTQLTAAPVTPVTKAGATPETTPESPPSAGEGTPEEAPEGTSGDLVGDSWEQEDDGEPRTLTGIMEDDLFSLRFDWPEGVAAAIYRRAGYLWFLFDHLETLRLASIVEKSEQRLEELIQVPDARATILRARVRSGINPSLRKEGNVWFVDLKPQTLQPEVPLMIKVEPEAEAGPRLFLSVDNAVDKMAIRDTVVGDKLFVVPVPGLGQGINRNRSYAQFLLIGTAQGVVVEPYTDGLDVRVEADGVEIRSQDDLFISARPANFDEASLLAGDFDMEDSGEFEPMLNMERWALGPSPWFYESRKILLGEIAAAPPAERNQLRLQLAQYYFANGMPGDAASLLKVIGEEEPEMAEEADYKLFLGISLFMNGNYLESGKYLYSQGMAGSARGGAVAGGAGRGAGGLGGGH